LQDNNTVCTLCSGVFYWQTARLTEASSAALFFAGKCLKCGLAHSDAALAGRKSGLPEMTDDDLGTDSGTGCCVFPQIIRLPAIACEQNHTYTQANSATSMTDR
jgi:hypothetical protein